MAARLRVHHLAVEPVGRFADLSQGSLDPMMAGVVGHDAPTIRRTMAATENRPLFAIDFASEHESGLWPPLDRRAIRLGRIRLAWPWARRFCARVARPQGQHEIL